MSAARLEAALGYDYAALARVSTRAFEGYLAPVAFDAASLEARVRTEAIDLSASKVLVLDGAPAGVALVARRGRSARIAAMGLCAEARGKKLGKRLLDAVLADCVARGDRGVQLEVIEGNEPALALYRGAGFGAARRLVGWDCAPAPGEPAALAEVDPSEVARALGRDASCDLPWQISGETVAQLALPHRAYRCEEALAVLSVGAARLALRALVVPPEARGRGHATRLLRALQAAHPGKALSVPALVPERPAFFARMGFTRDPLAQWELRRAL